MGICVGYKGTLAAVDRIRKEFDAKVMGWKQELKVKLKSIKSNLRELIAETGLVMFNWKSLRQMKKMMAPLKLNIGQMTCKWRGCLIGKQNSTSSMLVQIWQSFVPCDLEICKIL